ncbi:MAG TPA: HD domain-containing protein [Candidatus Paceibacterota bacterium]
MPQPQSTQERALKEIINLAYQASVADIAIIARAHEFTAETLKDKIRKSGESYIAHSIETAKTLASWKLPTVVIVAGLLHSTTGSGTAKEDDIKREFGQEILNLVKGTRSLTDIHYKGMEKHAEDLRRFFVAFSKDLRIIFIAFAHRLHTMNILSKRTKEDQLQVARETLEIYAPLANRLSMGRVKMQFETLAFPYVYPNEFEKVSNLLKKRASIATKNLEKIYRSLRKYFAKNSLSGKIPILEVDYRLKNPYSLWKKLQRYDFDISKINDLLALRIITDTVENCYKILGLIHTRWRPMPGKVKDYIANPKPNGYKSVHTTIYTGDGAAAEIQIRTKEMHEEAEFGMAATVAYEESDKPDTGGKWENNLSWVKELLNIAKKSKNVSEFVEMVRLDLFRDRIFVFTPMGDVIELPEGASPIDFAYAIHSDLGNHAHAVKINGKYKSLDTPLHGTETIEIETSKSAHPTRKWLDFTKTSEARQRIRVSLERKIAN